MQCPACGSKLAQISAYGLHLDVCTESCGGVWFDADELVRVDEKHERVDSRVLRPMGNQQVAVDRSKARRCPSCPGSVMERHLSDKDSNVEIDICSTCDGVWLDFGELDTIRRNNTMSAERSKVIDGYLKRYAKDPDRAPRGLRAVCELLFR